MAHDLAGAAAPGLPGEPVEVRAADAGGDDVEHDLVRSGFWCRAFLHRDVVVTPEHQRPHGCVLLMSGGTLQTDGTAEQVLSQITGPRPVPTLVPPVAPPASQGRRDSEAQRSAG